MLASGNAPAVTASTRTVTGAVASDPLSRSDLGTSVLVHPTGFLRATPTLYVPEVNMEDKFIPCVNVSKLITGLQLARRL